MTLPPFCCFNVRNRKIAHLIVDNIANVGPQGDVLPGVLSNVKGTDALKESEPKEIIGSSWTTTSTFGGRVE